MGKWSVDSKFGDLLKNPKTREIMEQFVPGCSTHPKSRLAFGLTVRDMSKYPQMGLSPDQVEELDKALQAVE